MRTEKVNRGDNRKMRSPRSLAVIARSAERAEAIQGERHGPGLLRVFDARNDEPFADLALLRTLCGPFGSA